MPRLNPDTFTYDAAGNMQSDIYNPLNFDGENQVHPASGIQYYYDGDGHRVAKSDGSRYWYDDNFKVLSTADSSNTLKRDYFYFNGTRLGWVTVASGDAHYYLNDHLGSPRVIANGDGSFISWEADYRPYGQDNVISNNDGLDVFFLSTGYEYDYEMNPDADYYANLRYMSASLGRFFQPDPVGGDPTNPQSWNRYAYALNNPTNLIDPLGLADCPFTFCIVVTAAPLDPFTSDPFFLCGLYGFCGAGRPEPLNPGEGPDRSGVAKPGNSTPKPQPKPKNTLQCFISGAKHGAVGSLLVAGGAAVAGAFVAPELVTAGLFVAGVGGTALLVRSGINHYLSGNKGGLAYDAGSAVGGLAVGGVTSFGVRASITGETNLPTSVSDFLGFGKTIEIRPGQTPLQALQAAFSKGPDLGGAGLAVATAGAGAGSESECH